MWKDHRHAHLLGHSRLVGDELQWELHPLQDVGQLVSGLETENPCKPEVAEFGQFAWEDRESKEGKQQIRPPEEVKRKGYLTTEGGREERRARGTNQPSLQPSWFLTWSFERSFWE